MKKEKKKMEKRESLKQLTIYHSPDGTRAGAAAVMGLNRQTVSNAVNGRSVGKDAAIKISQFVKGEYSIMELMGIDKES